MMKRMLFIVTRTVRRLIYWIISENRAKAATRRFAL
jgi:hypothetical protein